MMTITHTHTLTLALTDWRYRGGSGRRKVLGEVQVTHVFAAAAETVGAVLDVRRRLRHLATVAMAHPLVTLRPPATCSKNIIIKILIILRPVK